MYKKCVELQVLYKVVKNTEFKDEFKKLSVKQIKNYFNTKKLLINIMLIV